MNLDSYRVVHDWGAILPEIILGVGALVLLVLEVLLPALKRWLPHLAIALQAGLAAWLAWALIAADTGAETRELFGGMLAQDGRTDLIRIFFLLSGVVVCHLGMTWLRDRPYAKVEFFHLVLVINAAFLLLVQSAHFAMLFVALETVTIGFYILVAYARSSSLSLEAGLKYLITGSLSSGIMLFGIVLLFGAASNPLFESATTTPLQFGAFADFVTGYYRETGGQLPLYALVGAGLVLAGVAFKIGLVPFQIWIPDVYQGAPVPVTAFLAVASKAAGVFVLLNLLQGPFAGLEAVTIPLLTVFTGLTLLFGNLAALPQRNVKRLMGLSGVAHAGILILGVLAAREQAWLVPVVFFYLTVYALASFGVFEVMAHVGPREDAEQEFEDYSELLQQQPVLGGALVLGLGSLAGIPPLAGFIAKVLIFYGALQAGLYVLLGLAIFGVVCSIYYYFGWLRASVTKSLFPDEERGTPRSPLAGARLILYTVSALTLLFGLYQGVFQLGY
jgi:NADH-quinone oxidoreductase subunit N